MRFANILNALYCQPWLVTPQMHRTICGVVHQRLAGGKADIADMVDEMFPPPEPILTMRGDLAVVRIDGVIANHVGKVEKSCGVVDASDLVEAIKTAGATARGVMLWIDSPGGQVTGTPEVAEAVAALQVPCVAYTSNLCCSAAYWIASQADAFYCSPSAVVGSIGVYSAYLDSSRAYEMAGYKVDLFSAGTFKAAGLEGVSLTEAQRTEIQASIDSTYAWFVGDVLKTREIAAGDMQGQTFYGKDAVDKGLADACLSFDEAMADLNTMTEL